LLHETGGETGSDCIVPEFNGKFDPLCAVYHRRVLVAVESAIHQKLFKMQDFILTLRISRWPLTAPLVNVNSPADWSAR